MFQVQAIVPDQPLIDPAQLMQAINAGLDTTALWVQSDFNQTIQTWNHQVEFPITTPQDLQREITTTDQIYTWVNNGTNRHGRFVEPHNPDGFLRFTVPFAPKTQKNVIGSYGGNRGDTKIFAKRVPMSSIQAREFDETIAREFNTEDRLGKIIQENINQVVSP